MEKLNLEQTYEDEKLRKSIKSIIDRFPDSRPVFQDISSYILLLKSRNSSLSSNNSAEPVSKRRKVGTGAIEVNRDATSLPAGGKKKSGDVLLSVPDISFSIPQRKKYTLVITSSGVSAMLNNEEAFGITFDKIRYIVCLKVPERASKQWNFCMFSQNGDGSDIADAIVFSVGEGVPNNISGSLVASLSTAVGYKDYIRNAINHRPPLGTPVEDNDGAYFVKAHLGTKEGFLFFLKDTIVWGFKKPLYCFFFRDIDSICYSNITQRTFNLTVSSDITGNKGEVEFAMIDQAEYSTIDEYIRNNNLSDVSRAESRRAKALNINGKQKENDKEAPAEIPEQNITLNSHTFDEYDDEDDDDDDDFEANSSDGSEDENDSDADSSTGSANS